MNNGGQRYLFIVNPISGTGVGREEFAEQIELFGQDKGINIIETWQAMQPSQLVELLIGQDLSDLMLVACGGDGTMALCFTAGHLLNLNVGLVPLGSGNGLAHDMGFTSLERAFEALYEPQFKKIDAIQINGKKLCWHISDLGFNAHIVSKYAEEGLRGNLNYALHSVAEFVDFTAGRVQINTQDHRIDNTFFMVAGANTRMFGTNVMINPNAKLNDGLFELCLIRDFSKFEGPGLLLDLVGGNLADSGHVHTLSVSEATITNMALMPFQVDGEFEGYPVEAKLKAIPGAVSMAMHPDYTPSSLFT